GDGGTGIARGAFATIGLTDVRDALAKGRGNLGRVVGRFVVDEDNLGCSVVGQTLIQRTFDRARQVARLVVRRYDGAERGRHRATATSACAWYVAPASKQ